MTHKSPQTLKGFRDFLPSDKYARDHVQQSIQKTFIRFGFDPIETPTLEYASLLLGKYGEEADKLVYTFEDKGGRHVGLRYDQTVPTARVLSQYQHQLPKYFRRYQIQNVFRADKPQKGRYREFTHCDADIFNTSSHIADAEILAVFYHVFKDIGFNTFTIKINYRPAIFELINPFTADHSISSFSLLQSVDKLDKKTQSAVKSELIAKGLTPTAADKLLQAFANASFPHELETIITYCEQLGVPRNTFSFTPTLVRGLDYYTGVIFEGHIPEFSAGSVGGGGRYDNLIHDLNGIHIPAVGFGIGFDRTVEAATQLNLLPTKNTSTKILVTIFDRSTEINCLNAITQIRQNHIPAELFPAANVPLSKQFKYANQKKIPFVLVLGPEEISQQVVTLKNMQSGEQTTDSLDSIINQLRQLT